MWALIFVCIEFSYLLQIIIIHIHVCMYSTTQRHMRMEFYFCVHVVFQLLARLLKSKHPEDLQAANRLIKSMVRQVSQTAVQSCLYTLNIICSRKTAFLHAFSKMAIEIFRRNNTWPFTFITFKGL